jgi:uncharacterized Fe-S radical SAM superfamily protein PflX
MKDTQTKTKKKLTKKMAAKLEERKEVNASWHVGQHKLKYKIISELKTVPGIGKVMSHELYNIKIHGIDDLKRKRADTLFEMHNKLKRKTQDRCVLYAFRCAIDYANQSEEGRKNYNKNWWDFKD